MKPIFHSNLINGPFDDPGLYIEIFREKRALLFDLGEIKSLSTSKLLKVSDVFVSHTHIDHFIGFDHLLRLLLGREKRLRVFGPPGIISNIEGKLAAYTWNLVGDYPFVLEAVEISPDKIRGSKFICKDRFNREDNESDIPFDGTLIDEPLLRIEGVHLDHLIPCMAFSLSEEFHININKDALIQQDLPVGPWLGELKRCIREGRSDEYMIAVPMKRGIKMTGIGELKDEFVMITKGQKVAYVVDAVYSEENIRKIIHIAQDCDILYCEAAFIEEETERARERYHLTARQAGELARLAGAKRLEIFHFSPRYQNMEDKLYKEAMEEFNQKT
ncbi:MAG: ribonuclease Z [Nitrospinota bacterium]